MNTKYKIQSGKDEKALIIYYQCDYGINEKKLTDTLCVWYSRSTLSCQQPWLRDRLRLVIKAIAAWTEWIRLTRWGHYTGMTGGVYTWLVWLTKRRNVTNESAETGLRYVCEVSIDWRWLWCRGMSRILGANRGYTLATLHTRVWRNGLLRRLTSSCLLGRNSLFWRTEELMKHADTSPYKN